MAINIPSLFSDIIGTDEQRRLQMLQEGDLLARQLTGNLRTGAGASLGQRLTATAAPTVTAIAGQLPQRREDIRRAAGGMLGLDVRTEGEKVADVLGEGFNTDPSGLRDLSKRLLNVAPVQAAGLMQLADEKDAELAQLQRQEQLDNLQIRQLEGALDRADAESKAQQSYRDYVAELVKETRFDGFSEGIRDGSVPQDRLQKIVDQITEKIDPTSLDVVAAVVSGEQKVLHSDGFGNYFTLNGEKISLGEEDRVAPISATGTFQEVAGLTETQNQKLKDMQVGVANFIATSNNTISQLEQNENLNTSVAGIARVTADVAQNAKAFARTIGLEASDNIFDLETYSEDFDSLNIESSELKSSILGLALQYAAASGLGTGRALTDNDIKRAIQSLGFDRADPDAIISVLRDRQQELIDRFKTVYEVNYQQPFAGNFGLDMDRPVSELINEG